MAQGLEFDPLSENAANSPLSLFDTSTISVIAHSYPAPTLEVQWASSADTEGERAASRRYTNRQISLTLECATAAALRALQAKASKISREGGTLKWTLPNNEVVVFDLLAATTYEPTFDIAYHLSSGAFCQVQIGFMAMPFGRGVEQDLGDNVETTLPALFWTDTGVKGDVPALGRLVIDNDQSGYFPTSVAYAVQSRDYSSASTAALFIEAETGNVAASGGLTFGATAAVGPAGATGALTNKVMQHLDVGTTGADSFSMSLTHLGAFRVFARVYAPNANAGIVSLRMMWHPRADNVATAGIGNAWAPVVNSANTALEDLWCFVDLGLVNLPEARVGNQSWMARIQAKSTVATDDVNIDSLVFMPVTEGYGWAEGMLRNVLLPSRSIQIDHESVEVQRSISAWSGPDAFWGDYLLIPPAGPEGRTLRMIVLVTGTAGVGYGGALRNGTIPDVSARLYYTPRYLVVPEP